MCTDRQLTEDPGFLGVGVQYLELLFDARQTRQQRHARTCWVRYPLSQRRLRRTYRQQVGGRFEKVGGQEEQVTHWRHYVRFFMVCDCRVIMSLGNADSYRVLS